MSNFIENLLTNLFIEKKSSNKKNKKSKKHIKKIKNSKQKDYECERDKRIGNLFPIKREKKAIAILQIDDPTYPPDNNIRDSIFYYWYMNTTLPRFPIIKTDGTVEDIIRLLDKYYAEGYRYFLGLTRSTLVKGTLEWFINHPDALGISLRSKSEDLIVPKNVYRMASPNINIVDVLKPQITSAGVVYYVYLKDEVVTESFLVVLKALEESGQINELKSYGVLPNNSNLTVSNLQTFFNGATSNDISIIYLFDNEAYINLYNQGLTFPGNQYDILADIPPTITGTAQTLLNGKYYYVLNIYPNTSLLWRKDYDYLSAKTQNNFSNSQNLLNAMKMIQYFLLGKDITTLGSYSGTLEFDSITKDIQFPSYLVVLYNGIIDEYIKNYLYFNDPLLGKFDASFIPV